MINCLPGCHVAAGSSSGLDPGRDNLPLQASSPSYSRGQSCAGRGHTASWNAAWEHLGVGSQQIYIQPIFFFFFFFFLQVHVIIEYIAHTVKQEHKLYQIVGYDLILISMYSRGAFMLNF